MTIAAGGDFNRDGIADYLIGVPKNDTGGTDLGAVYAAWGGSRTTIDLSLVGVGIGGVMIDGAPNLPAFAVGAGIGTSVAALPDMNGDGTPDILISNPVGVSSQVTVLFSPASWQPETNIYGSNDDDVIGVGDGTAHRIGDGNDEVYGFAGNDTITTAGGNDTLNGGAGADFIDGGAGIDGVIYSARAVNIVLADSPTDGFANNDGTGAAAQLQFATLIPAATLSNVDFMVV